MGGVFIVCCVLFLFIYWDFLTRCKVVLKESVMRSRSFTDGAFWLMVGVYVFCVVLCYLLVVGV